MPGKRPIGCMKSSAEDMVQSILRLPTCVHVIGIEKKAGETSGRQICVERVRRVESSLVDMTDSSETIDIYRHLHLDCQHKKRRHEANMHYCCTWISELRNRYRTVNPATSEYSMKHVQIEIGIVDATIFDDEIIRCAYDHEFEYIANIPQSVFCAITNAPMLDPVILACDGNSYERTAIVKWLKRNKSSPMTGERIKFPIIIPNHNLRCTIQELTKAPIDTQHRASNTQQSSREDLD